MTLLPALAALVLGVQGPHDHDHGHEHGHDHMHDHEYEEVAEPAAVTLLREQLAEPLSALTEQLQAAEALTREGIVAFAMPEMIERLTSPTEAAARSMELARMMSEAPALQEITALEHAFVAATAAPIRQRNPYARLRVPQPDASAYPDVASTSDAVTFLRDQVQNAARFEVLEEREQAFADVAAMVRGYGPQWRLDEQTRSALERDFALLKRTPHAWYGSELPYAAVAKKEELRQALSGKRLRSVCPETIDGPIVYCEKTEAGWIIVGDEGHNAYQIDFPVALLLDFGGDDAYQGVIASNFSAMNPVSVLLDYSGNDAYQGDDFGLATGRLGFAALFDFEGDDSYRAGLGGGATGFLGAGWLFDLGGNDAFQGSAWNFGASIGGVGQLHNQGGNDAYESDIYGLGIGGAGGIGSLIDTSGNDAYRIGFTIPSGYNQAEWTSDDPQFQYQAWGMGCGLGRRIWPVEDREDMRGIVLAGGSGMLWDLAGNDSYESSNFSQGVGYFFGSGLKMDLSGNDSHTAARYGMGSSAHFGIGEFIEMAGDDVYDSTGPTYNAGCAWDQSLAIFLEGAGDDVYNLTRSAGPGRGDINSFGFAAELGGNDMYNLNGMPAGFSRGGVSAFFDLAGPDRFVIGGEAKEWVGETLEVNPEGSLTYLVPSED